VPVELLGTVLVELGKVDTWLCEFLWSKQRLLNWADFWAQAVIREEGAGEKPHPIVPSRLIGGR
jgi:hypothetical protein